MREFSVQEAGRKLAELVELAKSGQTIVLMEDGVPVVGIHAVFPQLKPLKGPRQLDGAKGQIIMSDDFDDPLPEFADYM